MDHASLSPAGNERLGSGGPHLYRSRDQKLMRSAEQCGDSPSWYYDASSRQPRRSVLCLVPAVPVGIGVLARTANGTFVPSALCGNTAELRASERRQHAEGATGA